MKLLHRQHFQEYNNSMGVLPMEVSDCDDVLRFLKSNYCKLLIVNLTQDSYCPKIIADDELEAMGDIDCVFSHYTSWFVTGKFIMAEDREVLRGFFAKEEPIRVAEYYLQNDKLLFSSGELFRRAERRFLCLIRERLPELFSFLET